MDFLHTIVHDAWADKSANFFYSGMNFLTRKILIVHIELIFRGKSVLVENLCQDGRFENVKNRQKLGL